ncbi:MAG: biotin carboxylase N-terminal domain-containing protein [Acidimicrobiales bacterium]
MSRERNDEARTPRRLIDRLLVANRGEIARRVIATASSMGISTVAVFSDADVESPHVEEADLAVRLPGVLPAETYLRGDLVLEAAMRTGATAVHPGYGFLSESAAFAEEVTAAGLAWVGPPASAIEAMGSKIGAKELMREAGVPTLPSLTVGDALPEEAELKAIGWPLLVKASAGGGGRGMRIVAGPEELADALSSARREAAASFGDDTVFLERYLEGPRHIEVQVIADCFGETVALFERECSIQRRHQKIIEEAPAPTITAELRSTLSEAAVAAARAVRYVNAGTVEFVVGTGDGEGTDPYFLEMNTRLQVEHPVTEAVTGLDLVRLQLLIAAGAPLPREVHDAAERGPLGHAVEARLYAEDPAKEWLPSTGTLQRFEIARRGTVRVDTGVRSGSVVSPYYDPMLAKVIVHAPSRVEASASLASTLAASRIHGVVTNRDLLVRTLRHPAFVAGETDTGFLERHGLERLAAPLADDRALARHAVAAALAAQSERRHDARVQSSVPSGFRNNGAAVQEVAFESGRGTVSVGYAFEPRGRRLSILRVDGEPSGLAVPRINPEAVDLSDERGVLRSYRVERVGATSYVDGPDGSSTLVEHERLPAGAEQAVAGSALAPMPGGVVRVAVAPGDVVEAGQVLVVLEAMKMEHAVHAAAAGTVVSVEVAEGDQVETGRVLAIVDADQGGGEGGEGR